MRPACLVMLAVPFFAAPIPRPDPDKVKKEAIEKDVKQLKGKWKIVSMEARNGFQDPMMMKTKTYTFTDDTLTMNYPKERTATYVIDPTVDPKSIDFKYTSEPFKGETGLCIYKFEGEHLTLCTGSGTGNRPHGFIAKKDTAISMVFVLERVKE